MKIDCSGIMELNVQRRYKAPVMFMGFLLYSFILLFFCTMSSPLYYFNNWDDANAYFTMGKGLFNGKVIYQELFDHKGPLLYFIFGIGYLISNTSFFGVYILQSLSLAVTLFFLYKIVSLFIQNKFVLLVVPLYSALLLGSRIIEEGGSAEEFMLPFISAGLFYSLRIFALNGDGKFNAKTSFILGFCTAAIFLIKLNIVMMFFPFLAIAFLELLFKRQYKNVLFNGLGYILGLSVTILPFFLFFIITNSLFDAYMAYIKFNTLYANVEIGLGTLLLFIITVLQAFYTNATVSVLLLYGLVVFILSGKYLSITGKISLFLSFAALLFVSYGIGRNYRYNYIPVTVFIVFAIVMLIEILPDILKKNKWYGIILVVMMIPMNKNISYSKLFSDEPLAVIFSRMVKTEPNPDIIYYDMLDFGIQNVVGFTPSQKYYYHPGISSDVFPEILNKQEEAIKNKAVSFVLVTDINTIKNGKPEFYNILINNYEILGQAVEKRREYTLLRVNGQ